MKRFFGVVLVGLVAAVATFAGGSSALAGDAACGEKGQPSCPLQGWMEQNMQTAYDKEDLKALEAMLAKVPEFVPDPKWNEGDQGWSKIATDGAAKAKAGDFKGVQATCKGCHSAWRKKYRAEHRPRPLPAAKAKQ